MAERQITDAEALALSGAIVGAGCQMPSDDEADWDHAVWRSLARLSTAACAAAGLEVVKDASAPLRVYIRSGRVMDGDVAYDYAALPDQPVEAGATNYVYLTAADLEAGTATINTTGFPDPAETPHVPLATVLCGAQDFAWDDITDYRGRSILRLASDLTAAEANVLVGGEAADALHTHAAAGLAEALQDAIPSLAFEGLDGEDGTGEMAIQVVDADNNNLAERFRVRVWRSSTQFGAPEAITDFSIVSGAELREIVADADYELITDADGFALMRLEDDGTHWVMAEVDGRVYSASVIVTDT